VSDYSKIYDSLYTGETGRAIRGCWQAQVLMPYLIRNPHANQYGLYYLPMSYIIHDLGHPAHEMRKGLERLEQEGFAYYDDTTEYVFVVEMCHVQTGRLNAHGEKGPDKRIKGANRFYAEVQKNPFLGMFYDRYADDLCLTIPKRDHPSPSSSSPSSEGGFKGASSPLEGSAKGTEGSMLCNVDVDVDANASVFVLEDRKDQRLEATKDPSIDSTLRGRRFSDEPQHLVDLWNEQAPAKLHRVHKLTDGLRTAIKLAYKQLPERRDWEQIMQEIESSEFLQSASWFNFPWLVKAPKNEAENYMKVLAGN
jgi:hypothetical protein